MTMTTVANRRNRAWNTTFESFQVSKKSGIPPPASRNREEIARAMTIPQSWAKSGWINQRQSVFRVKLDPVLFKIQTLLTAIRAVNWCWRD
jgi:hypothetical protein